MTTPNNQAGIPGGGLFNEIYAAHYRQGSTNIPRFRTELGTWRHDQPINPDHYAYDDELGCGAGCALVAVIFAVLVFVLPDYVQGFWLLVAFIALPILGWKYGKKLILDRRNRQRNQRLDTEHVRKQATSAAPDPLEPPASETYPSLYKGQDRVDLGTLKQQCMSVYEHMQRTGNVPDYVDTSVAGFSNYFGAACEVTTAKALRSIPGCVVVNDIAIAKPDGRVTANIDHLACFPDNGTTVMVDSKFWSKPPTFTHNGSITSVDPHGEHARAVSTCIYEASFLPTPPLAIVFAVRGKASASLREPVSVDLYPDFDYDGNAKMKTVPFPVIFVDHAKLAGVVGDIRQGRSVAGAIARPAGRTDVLALTGQTRVGDNTLTPTTRLDFGDAPGQGY